MKSIIKYIGEKFGKITVLQYLGNKKVKYKCECGSEKITNFYDIKRGKVQSCGCWRNLPENVEKSRQKIKIMREKGLCIKKGSSAPRDELTPFKYVWKCINNKPAKNQGKRKPVLFKIEDLKVIWERQNGMCTYSNLKLILPTHTNIKKHPLYLYASLDRIDSNLPYTLDNCHFISKSLNFAKNNMSEKEFLDFLQILVKNRGDEGI